MHWGLPSYRRKAPLCSTQLPPVHPHRLLCPLSAGHSRDSRPPRYRPGPHEPHLLDPVVSSPADPHIGSDGASDYYTDVESADAESDARVQRKLPPARLGSRRGSLREGDTTDRGPRKRHRERHRSQSTGGAQPSGSSSADGGPNSASACRGSASVSKFDANHHQTREGNSRVVLGPRVLYPGPSRVP